MYKIIHHDRIKSILNQEFSKIEYSLQVISAYCTKSTLEYVDSITIAALVVKRLMVRFRLGDILNGATDFSIYEYCKLHGWKLFIQLDLHAKTFVFDKKRCIIGSANLTARGMELVEDSNLEMAVLAEVDEFELKKINGMFEHSTEMTDELYDLMEKQVEDAISGRKHDASWNKKIIDMMKDEITTLFTQDFLKSKSPNNILPDDYLLLQLPGGATDKSLIKSSFISTLGFKWLVQTLKGAENKQLYFGDITAQLHNVLINDPRPYRREAKDLLANLLAWIFELDIENIKIERPRYSQLISLTN